MLELIRKTRDMFGSILSETFFQTSSQIHFFSVQPGKREEFLRFCSENLITVLDTIRNQVEELAQITLVQASTKEISEFIKKEIHSSHPDLFHYGSWVYYPWKRTVVHLLPKRQFQLVRTNRNRDKISAKEQLTLQKKRIGIIGLSVGHSAAITLAQEGMCGEIRIADFDTIELSNLNRLRTSLINLAQEKSIVSCREILEIDPYIKVKIYKDGINDDNIESFFLDDGALDLVVEECDSLKTKLNARLFAKKQKIPVIMDTNDRGLIDIERFDQENDRQILHGLFQTINPQSLENLSQSKKLELIYTLLGGSENLSTAMRNSIQQIGKNLISFPQLASEVHLGGALVTYVARQILLDKKMPSGRYYVDLSELIR